MKFMRQFFDEKEPEEITEEYFCKKYAEDFKDVELFLTVLKNSAGKKYRILFAEYWFEN